MNNNNQGKEHKKRTVNHKINNKMPLYQKRGKETKSTMSN